MSKSKASEAQILANRANAKHSTGPKTAEGKAISRLNAITHGMRTEMVLLPGEDAVEFEQEKRGFMEDWKPQSQTQAALVDRLHATNWRLKRCVRIEHTNLRVIYQREAQKFDRTAQNNLVNSERLLLEDPATGLAQLEGTVLGMELLVQKWSELLDVLQNDPHDFVDPTEHIGTYLALMGYEIDTDFEDLPLPAKGAKWIYQQNCHPEVSCHPDDWNEATSFAIEHAQSQIAHYEGVLAKRYSHKQLRQNTIESKLIDVSKPALTLQRYEFSLDRVFHATLNKVMAFAKTNVDTKAATLTNEANFDASAHLFMVCDPVVPAVRHAATASFMEPELVEQTLPEQPKASEPVSTPTNEANLAASLDDLAVRDSIVEPALVEETAPVETLTNEANFAASVDEVDAYDPSLKPVTKPNAAISLSKERHATSNEFRSVQTIPSDSHPYPSTLIEQAFDEDQYDGDNLAEPEPADYGPDEEQFGSLRGTRSKLAELVGTATSSEMSTCNYAGMSQVPQSLA
jgi:hypothetical protein